MAQGIVALKKIPKCNETTLTLYLVIPLVFVSISGNNVFNILTQNGFSIYLISFYLNNSFQLEENVEKLLKGFLGIE